MTAIEPTNVLFVFADELTPRVLGYEGDAFARTPNLDALASWGTRFAEAYCQSPLCVPSRASLATGRYPHTIDSWDNATPYTGLPHESWGHRLTEQGHRVVTIGKLHYRSPSDPTGFPDQRLPMHVVEGGGDPFPLLRGLMPPGGPGGRNFVLRAGAGEVDYDRYDREVADETCRWLTDEGDRDTTPWVLFCSFVRPHFPLIAPQAAWDQFDPNCAPLPPNWDRAPTHEAMAFRQRCMGLEEPFTEDEVRNAVTAYYALCTSLDDNIGRVLDAVHQAGLVGRTRVIFSADHGEMRGAHAMWSKLCMYEDSVRVPLVVAGADIEADAVCPERASLLDVFPTMVESVGARLEDRDRGLPGRSLWSALTDPERDRLAFSEYHNGAAPSGQFMIRSGRWKYVHYVGMAPQLFDLDVDPDETVDLGTDPAHAATRDGLHAELVAICDPEAVDARAKADQARRLDDFGGVDAVLQRQWMSHTPAPAARPS